MKNVWLSNLFLLCLSIHAFLPCYAVSLDGITSVVYQASAYSFAGGDTATGFVRFEDGFSVPAGRSVTLNVVVPVNGALDLHASGELVLDGDLVLASGATLPNGGKINGQENVVFLGGDLTIPKGKTLKISGNTVIDGQGHELIFEDDSNGAGGGLSIDGDDATVLILRNMTVKGLKNYTSRRSITFGNAEDQSLVLNNVIMNLDGDFTFNGGDLEIQNDVVFCGAHTFNYRSSYDCIIDQHATLMLDMDVVFKYAPEDKEKTHFVLTDRSSTLFFNGGTLETPRMQGMILTKGHIVVDHKSYLNPNEAVRDNYGVTFGDGNKDNDVLIDIKPGASFEVYHGILTYNNGGDEVEAGGGSEEPGA